MTTPYVLLADDDRAIRLVAQKALEKAGFRVHSVDRISSLMEVIVNPEFQVLVTDVAFPDGDALDLLPEIKSRRPDLPIILMSARSTLLTAVKAQERGVAAYLPKPFPLDDLVSAVEGLKTSIEAGTPEADISPDQSPLIGRSPAMQDIFRSMARLVHTNLSVMITGESGTGKEVVARALHDLGERRKQPFVAINMAAIPRELIESELFGHEKGAFTGADRVHDGRFAQASGGTLFLDEIGDMPAEAQTRLLRVLQDGAYTRVGGNRLLRSNVRIIAATHKNLPDLIAEGNFREDLYYRLNVVPLNLPPLRERNNDIPDLCQHFILRTVKDGFPTKKFSADAMDALMAWHWPGNIRELENLIWRLAVLVDDPVIEANHLGPMLIDVRGQAGVDDDTLTPGQSATLGQLAHFHIERFLDAHASDAMPTGIHDRIMAEVEKPLIEISLRYTGGNQLRAADMLGVNRNTLRKKIKQLGIDSGSIRRRVIRG